MGLAEHRQLARREVQRCDEGSSRPARRRDSWVVDFRPVGSVAPPRALPHPLGRRAQPPPRGRGRLPAGPHQRRRANHRESGRGRPRRLRDPRHAGTGDQPGRDRRHSVGRRHRVALPPGRRRDTAVAVGPLDLRTAATFATLAARRAHAVGIDHQDLGRVRHSVLAGRRIVRPVGRRGHADRDDPRRVSGIGPPGRDRGLLVRPARPRPRRARRNRTATCRDDRPRTALREQGGRRDPLRGTGLVGGTLVGRLLPRAHAARHAHAVRARVARAGRPYPLGLHRGRHRLARHHRRRHPLRRPRRR